MAARRFTLYDFIVDLIPGVATIGLLVILVPQHPIIVQVNELGVIPFTLGVLASGYVAGRIIHGMTGVTHVEKLAKIIANTIPYTPTDSHYLEFDERVKYILKHGCKTSIEYSIAQWIVNDNRKDIISSQTIPGSSFYVGEISKRKPGQIGDLEYSRYLADSALYSRQSLSWKYSILATFFRNLWFIFLGFGLIYAVIGYCSRPGLLEFSVVLLVCGYVSLHQRFKFKRRQIRAMLNEFYLIEQSDPTANSS